MNSFEMWIKKSITHESCNSNLETLMAESSWCVVANISRTLLLFPSVQVRFEWTDQFYKCNPITKIPFKTMANIIIIVLIMTTLFLFPSVQLGFEWSGPVL